MLEANESDIYNDFTLNSDEFDLNELQDIIGGAPEMLTNLLQDPGLIDAMRDAIGTELNSPRNHPDSESD